MIDYDKALEAFDQWWENEYCGGPEQLPIGGTAEERCAAMEAWKSALDLVYDKITHQ